MVATGNHDLRVVVADITTLAVDAVVNAAAPALLGGGGVDGAIHAAAGPDLRAACAQLPETSSGVRCPTGDARITPGFRLTARWVIHTVGPVWRGGTAGEAAALASCYRRSLELAAAHRVTSIAFPAISAGIYGYPRDEAAEVAVDTLRLHAHVVDTVLLCAYDAGMAVAYRKALAR